VQKYLTEAAICDLSDLLEKELGLSFAEFHGFLTAIVGGPAIISPSEWIEAIGLNNIFFSNQEVAQRYIGTVMILYGSILEDLFLQKFTVKYMPNSAYKFKTDAEKEEAAEKWASGYYKGVEMGCDAWFGVDEKEDDIVAELLFPVTSLLTTVEDLAEDIPEKSKREEALGELRKMSIESLTKMSNYFFLYWLSKRNPHLFVDEECGTNCSCNKHDVKKSCDRKKNKKSKKK